MLMAAAGQALAQAAGSAPLPVVTGLSVTDEGVTLELDSPAAVTVRHLAAPERIVIDLPEAAFLMAPADVGLPGSVSALRFGRLEEGRSRIILTLAAPVWAVTGEGASSAPAASRQVITFSPVGADEFAALAEADLAAFAAPAPAGLEPGAPPAGKPFTLVIDPGHGGIDGGATGKLGTVEKDLTLAFALKLRNALADAPGIRVVLTRETDVFVPLRERVLAARRNHADLLLSIHADSIDDPSLRGATVYTLSDSASDAISRQLAENENLADTVAGLPADQPDPVVNDILADLLKRETAGFSRAIAAALIVELKGAGVRMINNPKRSAGFRVLTAPDVPSLLLELGYLSNVEDERLMREEDWRLNAAGIIATAVRAHAATHAPAP